MVLPTEYDGVLTRSPQAVPSSDSDYTALIKASEEDMAGILNAVRNINPTNMMEC
jgi:hypothetical protein